MMSKSGLGKLLWALLLFVCLFVECKYIKVARRRVHYFIYSKGFKAFNTKSQIFTPEHLQSCLFHIIIIGVWKTGRKSTPFFVLVPGERLNRKQHEKQQSIQLANYLTCLLTDNWQCCSKANVVVVLTRATSIIEIQLERSAH